MGAVRTAPPPRRGEVAEHERAARGGGGRGGAAGDAADADGVAGVEGGGDDGVKRGLTLAQLRHQSQANRGLSADPIVPTSVDLIAILTESGDVPCEPLKAHLVVTSRTLDDITCSMDVFRESGERTALHDVVAAALNTRHAVRVLAAKAAAPALFEPGAGAVWVVTDAPTDEHRGFDIVCCGDSDAARAASDGQHCH
eukprot:gene46478-55395_t